MKTSAHTLKKETKTFPGAFFQKDKECANAEVMQRHQGLDFKHADGELNKLANKCANTVDRKQHSGKVNARLDFTEGQNI